MINGLAVAPDGVFCNTGVSTSMNPLSHKNSLISLMNLDLSKKRFLVSSFIIRSRCLSLYRVSWFEIPWNFSGSGLIAFPKNS